MDERGGGAYGRRTSDVASSLALSRSPSLALALSLSLSCSLSLARSLALSLSLSRVLRHECADDDDNDAVARLGPKNPVVADAGRISAREEPALAAHARGLQQRRQVRAHQQHVQLVLACAEWEKVAREKDTESRRVVEIPSVARRGSLPEAPAAKIPFFRMVFSKNIKRRAASLSSSSKR